MLPHPSQTPDSEKMKSDKPYHHGDLRNALILMGMRMLKHKSIAELSVFNAANPIDVSQYEGQLITKDVVINAKVRTPDEQTVDKKLDVIMSRAELKGPTGDVRNGRWIITSIKEAGT